MIVYKISHPITTSWLQFICYKPWSYSHAKVQFEVLPWTPSPVRALRYAANVETNVFPSPVFISAIEPSWSTAPPIIYSKYKQTHTDHHNNHHHHFKPKKSKTTSRLHKLKMMRAERTDTCTSKWRIPSFLFAASRTTANASVRIKSRRISKWIVTNKWNKIISFKSQIDDYRMPQPDWMSAKVSPCLSLLRNSDVFAVSWIFKNSFNFVFWA